MQFVPGISSAQTVSAAPAPTAVGRKRGLWILDSWQAKEHFQKASELNPKLAQPHNYLGKIFMREGKRSQAIGQFEEALRLHPDFPEAEENLRVAKESAT
ncbi:MAG TPA: tetratricopeptide repeat protein [Candidatus Udaeobacter sp.]|jgi:tetratricopeptide (TPR) repeat protein